MREIREYYCCLLMHGEETSITCSIDGTREVGVADAKSSNAPMCFKGGKRDRMSERTEQLLHEDRH